MERLKYRLECVKVYDESAFEGINYEDPKNAKVISNFINLVDMLCPQDERTDTWLNAEIYRSDNDELEYIVKWVEDVYFRVIVQVKVTSEDYEISLLCNNETQTVLYKENTNNNLYDKLCSLLGIIFYVGEDHGDYYTNIHEMLNNLFVKDVEELYEIKLDKSKILFNLATCFEKKVIEDLNKGKWGRVAATEVYNFFKYFRDYRVRDILKDIEVAQLPVDMSKDDGVYVFNYQNRKLRINYTAPGVFTITKENTFTKSPVFETTYAKKAFSVFLSGDETQAQSNFLNCYKRTSSIHRSGKFMAIDLWNLRCMAFRLNPTIQTDLLHPKDSLMYSSIIKEEQEKILNSYIGQ